MPRYILVILAVLFWASPAFGSSGEPPQLQQPQLQRPLTSPPETPKQATLDLQQRDLAAQVSMAKWAKWGLGVSVVQGLASAAGLIFIWLSLRESRRATTQSSRAAAAAEAAIRDSRETALRLQRPYVVLRERAMDWLWHVPHPDVLEDWRLTLVITNTGQTPAYEAKGWVVLKITSKDEVLTYEQLEAEESRHGTFGMIGPQQSMHSTAVMSWKSILAAQEEGKAIYYYARYRYTGLEPEVFHEIRICERIYVYGDPSKADCTFSFELTSWFNEEVRHPRQP